MHRLPPKPPLSPQDGAPPPDFDPVEDFIAKRRKTTINDIARLAEVSKKTVSRIINNSPNVRHETREKVAAIIARTGFKPDPQARGLAFRRSFLFGLVYDNPNAQYIVNIQQGVLDAVRGSGTELIVHPCERESASFLEDIEELVARQRLGGVIVLPPIAEDPALIGMLETLKVPYLRITARRGEENTPPLRGPQIVSNDAAGCQAAAEHLIRLGHRRIGFINGLVSYSSAHERRRGFLQGLKNEGLSIDPEIDLPGAYTYESGYEAGLKILKHPHPPTAIFASNDEMAVGVYKAARDRGLRIPEDLSVIGFDDAPIAARVLPALTTVRLPVREVGRLAAERLMAFEEANTHTVYVEAWLEVRESTGPVSG